MTICSRFRARIRWDSTSNPRMKWNIENGISTHTFSRPFSALPLSGSLWLDSKCWDRHNAISRQNMRRKSCDRLRLSPAGRNNPTCPGLGRTEQKYELWLLGSRFGCRGRGTSHRESTGLRTIPVPRPDVVLLQMLTHHFHCDGAPAPVGIRLRVVAERIEVREVVPNRGKGALFIFPVL